MGWPLVSRDVNVGAALRPAPRAQPAFGLLRSLDHTPARFARGAGRRAAPTQFLVKMFGFGALLHRDVHDLQIWIGLVPLVADMFECQAKRFALAGG